MQIIIENQLKWFLDANFGVVKHEFKEDSS